MNDLISRSALLEKIVLPLDYLSIYLVRETIKAAPAVDAEPVEYSMWLEHAGSQHTRYWTCLKCDTLGSPKWKRCPVCEAKMNAEVEG